MNTVTIAAIVGSITVIAAVVATTVILESDKSDPNVTSTGDADYMRFYQSNELPSDNFEVLDVYMRPDNTFIQGLYYDPATKLYWEGSGLWGESKVRYLKLDEKAKQLNYDDSIPEWNMSHSIFGEGICPLNDHDIAVLTW